MTVQINGDNTIAAPGFSGPDADTGLQTATNELSLVTGGSARLFIDSSGRVGVGTSSPTHTLEVAGKIAVVGTESALGNSSIPSIYRSGSDSGSYPFDDFGHLVVQPRCDGANRDIVFATGTSGANKVVINSSGRLGVGTTSPHQTLDIGGTTSALIKFSPTNQGTTATDGGYIGHNFGGYELWQYESNYMRFATANTERMRIDSSGRVGIGTSSPDEPLHVKASGSQRVDLAKFEFDGQQSLWVQGQWGSMDIGSTNGILQYTGGNIGFRTSTSGSADMLLDTSGRLGIGTTSPVADLDIAPANSSAILRVQARTNTSPVPAIELMRGTNTTFGADIYADYRIKNDNAQLVFEYAASGTTTERMRIDSSGRLLVGTSSTSNAYTSILAQGNASGANTDALLRLATENSSPANGAGLGGVLFCASNHGDTAAIRAFRDGGTWTNDSSEPTRLVFSTTADGASSPTERMRIDSNGTFTFQNSASAGLDISYSGNASYASIQHDWRVQRAANSGYSFLYARSGNIGDNEFILAGDGNAYADGSWSGGGADYAEYFEWFDGNTNAEDRRGISVVLDSGKMREAVAGEDPIGVISGNPSVVGDADIRQWKHKYQRDEFGSYVLDENGDRQLNPAYDPDQEYISREERPEWDCVGLMGKLRIRKGQVTGARWIKMRDVSDNVEEWLVR